MPAPSVRVGNRVNEPEGPVSPKRAVAGALVAVAGVVLGIWAVLTFTNEPDVSQDSTVSLPPLTSSSVSPSETPTPRPTPTVSPTEVPSTAPVLPSPTASPTPSPRAAAKPALTVLNNSRFKRLADRAAAQFRRGGWPVREVGNYSASNLPASTVYYAAGQRAAAEALAKAYGLRALPRFTGLPGSGLTVVLTRDYTS